MPLLVVNVDPHTQIDRPVSSVCVCVCARARGAVCAVCLLLGCRAGISLLLMLRCTVATLLRGGDLANLYLNRRYQTQMDSDDDAEGSEAVDKGEKPDNPHHLPVTHHISLKGMHLSHSCTSPVSHACIRT